MSKDIVSHGVFENYEDARNDILSRISNDVSLMSIFNDLENCELGRFLIQNRGLNAYWTKVITQNLGSYDCEFSTKLITLPKVFQATQSRYKIFKQEISNLANNSKIMSVPAGLLPEFSQKLILEKSFHIDAFDLDETCSSLSELASMENVDYKVADVFDLDIVDEYDAVVTNGLNIYLKTNQQVKQFFQILSHALKPGGKLISSFLLTVYRSTITPTESVLFGKTVFIDILNIAWSKTHSEDEFIDILNDCGFRIDRVIYDDMKLFPTVTATKIDTSYNS